METARTTPDSGCPFLGGCQTAPDRAGGNHEKRSAFGQDPCGEFAALPEHVIDAADVLVQRLVVYLKEIQDDRRARAVSRYLFEGIAGRKSVFVQEGTDFFIRGSRFDIRQ
jgi:hypothetical protein